MGSPMRRAVPGRRRPGQSRCRAIAISRDHTHRPISAHWPGRSARRNPAGISVVSTGAHGGGGGVTGDPSGLAVEPAPFSTGNATAVGTDCAAIPSCLSGGTVAVACLARRTTGSLGRNRLGGGIEAAELAGWRSGLDWVAARIWAAVELGTSAESLAPRTPCLPTQGVP